MLSMSGGVVHLTSRLVFCFASAPLVLVKLLRDAPLVPVEGLHADDFCGPPVAVTERGIAYILKDTAHADTDFHEMIKDKMETMGVLEYGEYEEVAQTDDCAYTWPTAGFRRRER